MRSWLHIGHVCEVPEPGSFIRRDVEFARASLLITRGKDGVLRSFHNACTHRGTQLTQDSCGKQATFSCPYHMWTFASDGSLVGAPDFARFSVSREDVALKQVRTEVLAGMIFVNFDPEPRQSVREFFGPIADELETLPVASAVDFTEWSYEIPANWKTNLDNFQENYHLRFIHPAACDQAAGPDNPFGYPTHYGFSGPHRSQTLWRNPNPPPPTAILVQGLGPGAELARRDGLNFPKTDFKLFPALHAVSIPPGQHFTHTHYPLGVDRTRGVIRMYWTREADCATRLFYQEVAANSLRDLLTEDRAIVQYAQRGLESGAIAHVHFQEHEILLRHLNEQVTSRVHAYVAECEARGIAP
jgi:phenylpropionate dioxygenase-like ring-hydroxylating dioxygenase large terminal subunit